MKEMSETRELVSLLWDIQNDSSFKYNMEFYRKQKKLMTEVDYLEVVVNTLGVEADNLESYLDNLENQLKELENKN
jgi:hypothetical protein